MRWATTKRTKVLNIHVGRLSVNSIRYRIMGHYMTIQRLTLSVMVSIRELRTWELRGIIILALQFEFPEVPAVVQKKQGTKKCWSCYHLNWEKCNSGINSCSTKGGLSDPLSVLDTIYVILTSTGRLTGCPFRCVPAEAVTYILKFPPIQGARMPAAYLCAHASTDHKTTL